MILVRSQNRDTYQYHFQEAALECETAGYEVDGNHYKVLSEDPNLVYKLASWSDWAGEIYGIRVTFEEAPSQMQIYYSDGEGFSEAQMTHVTKQVDGVMQKVFEEPYSIFRLDINEDFVLEKVEICTGKTIVHRKNISGYLIVVGVSLILAALLSYVKRLEEGYWFCIQKAVELCRTAKKKRTNVLKVIGAVLATVLLSFVLEQGIALLRHREFQMLEMLFAEAVLLVLLSAVVYWKSASKKPQVLFVVIALITGVFNILLLPRATGISLDDEVHYGRTAYLSYGAQDKISCADEACIENYRMVLSGRDIYDPAKHSEWAGYINQLDQEKPVLVDTEEYQTSLPYIAYLPSAFGVMLGRACNLTFTKTFMLGKLMNLLVYILLFYISIKQLKRGQLLLCVFGLVPTNLYLASAYAYDWWVTGFVVLGYAMLIGRLQRQDGEISFRYWLAILAVMVVGLLPKAIYFPIIFPMLFIGRKSFAKDTKQHWYWIVNFGAMLVLVLSFVMLMLLGSSMTDLRGGAGVDSGEQIAFILHNPVQYTKILLKVLADYISPNGIAAGMICFGYSMTGVRAVTPFVIIAVCAFLEGKRREKDSGRLFKWILAAVCFATVVLVVTSMYISYTEVGRDTIEGAQPRYLMPFIFPLLYYIPECNLIWQDANKRTGMAVSMCLMAVVYFVNAVQLV